MSDLEKRLREAHRDGLGDSPTGRALDAWDLCLEAADILAAMRESGAELRRTLAIAQGQVLVILNRGDTE